MAHSSKTKFFEDELFNNALLIKRLQTNWISLNEIKELLISKIPTTVPQKYKEDLISAIGYTGEYGRKFRKYGHELSMNDNGTRNYKTINGLQYIKISSSQVNNDALVVRQSFSLEVIKCFSKIGSKCAVSGVIIDGKCEIDHRIPMSRVKKESKIGNSLEEINNQYQGVSSRGNTKKRDVCGKCLRTGNRGKGTFKENISFWFNGTEKYDDVIGCNGCYWAYPEKWDNELNKKVSSQ
jgi:hypothetical protein